MFITIEGIEGSGKTTQLRHMVACLTGRGHHCVVTREPGGTEIGKKIRTILLDPSSGALDPMAELLLYAADRVQHINERVTPLLRDGKTVLCDRFIDSTVVYQGYARGIDVGLIHRLHRLILNGVTPDMTILLDLPPEMGLGRAWREINKGKRADNEIRFEEEAIVFHKKVRQGYLELSRLEPERFRVIDASPDEARVRREIQSVLSKC
jgi:dTMP kinase